MEFCCKSVCCYHLKIYLPAERISYWFSNWRRRIACFTNTVTRFLSCRPRRFCDQTRTIVHLVHRSRKKLFFRFLGLLVIPFNCPNQIYHGLKYNFLTSYLTHEPVQDWCDCDFSYHAYILTQPRELVKFFFNFFSDATFAYDSTRASASSKYNSESRMSLVTSVILASPAATIAFRKNVSAIVKYAVTVFCTFVIVGTTIPQAMIVVKRRF